MTMEKFAAQAKKENPDGAEQIIEKKKKEIERCAGTARLEELAGRRSGAGILARPVPQLPVARLVGFRQPVPWATWPATS